MAHEPPAALFPTDEPLKPGSLIGRADDVAEIANRLKLGSNVILSAPRGTGKTSVCDAVMADLEHDLDCYAVSIDLFGLDGTDQLADALIESAMSVRPALRRAIRAATQAGKTLYESLGVTLGAKALVTGELDGLEISLLPTLPTDRRKHLEYALELPQKIAAADGKRLVLCVDEFQAIQRIGDNNGGATVLKEQMRKVFQRSRAVSFLFAGSLEHTMRDLFSDKSEPFFNFGGFHSLRPITRDEWRDGISARLRTAGIGVGTTALDAIIDRGEGHPRSTMLVAQHAYEAAVLADADADTITSDTAALAYEAALLAERPKHEQMVERIQQGSTPAINRVALRTITALATGGKPYATAKHPSEATRALHALRDAGFIDRPAGSWRLTDPLFAEHLRRNRR